MLHFLSPIRGKFRRRASSFSTRVSHVAQRIRDSATVYDEDRFGRQDGCCDKDSFRECVRGAGPPFARNFISSAILKFLFELISTRSVTKSLKSMRWEVPRFGAIFGSAAAIFHLALCFLRRCGKRQARTWPKGLTEKSACLLAALVCVLPIALGLQKNEKNLVKLIFFPLAFRCLSNLLMEVGLVPTFKHGDILGYMFSCYAVVYSYVLERHSSSPAVSKMVR